MTATKTSSGHRSSLAVAMPTAQCLLGAALLSRPGPIARGLGGSSGSAPPRWVVRVLGGRLFIQGAVTITLPGAETQWSSAAVDGIHGASMLLVAAISPRYRRAAVINAAFALVSTAVSAGLATAHEGWRS